jgi:DcmR-like sensory protein
MLAGIIRQKLQQNYRCLYLNSSPMVAGMRSYLAAAGVDVAHEVEKTALVLTSEQGHLIDGACFDVERMMRSLDNALNEALFEGFAGLWATGDMTWELGPDKDFSKLLEYEWRLEEFFRSHPEIGGVCQYHAETLPRNVVQQGLLVHRALFINETLSLVNPHYLCPGNFPVGDGNWPEVETALRLFNSESAN